MASVQSESFVKAHNKLLIPSTALRPAIYHKITSLLPVAKWKDPVYCISDHGEQSLYYFLDESISHGVDQAHSITQICSKMKVKDDDDTLNLELGWFSLCTGNYILLVIKPLFEISIILFKISIILFKIVLSIYELYLVILSYSIRSKSRPCPFKGPSIVFWSYKP